jgi:hypothetical protein
MREGEGGRGARKGQGQGTREGWTSEGESGARWAREGQGTREGRGRDNRGPGRGRGRDEGGTREKLGIPPSHPFRVIYLKI